MSRKELIIITAPIKGIKSLHFTSTKLQGADLWFPLASTELFNLVEQLLTVNRIANNVTRIENIRVCALSNEYKVTYNEWEQSA